MMEIIKKIAFSRKIQSHEKHPDDKISKIFFCLNPGYKNRGITKNPESRWIFEIGQYSDFRKILSRCQYLIVWARFLIENSRFSIRLDFQKMRDFLRKMSLKLKYWVTFLLKVIIELIQNEQLFIILCW